MRNNNNDSSSSNNNNNNVPSVVERVEVWRGELEWREKIRFSSTRVVHSVHCGISSVRANTGSAEVNSARWPSKLIMQLLPKTIVSKFGGYYFRRAHSVLFQITESDNLQTLTRNMANGFAGVVHFSGDCDIKVLILLYSRDRRAYLGFIPHDQVGFVERIRAVLRREKFERVEE